jgi:Kef-type K+ transport system membrane component KefB
VILLFEAGVTSEYEAFMKVKFWAFVVACVGVTFPFIFGYFVAHFFGLDTIRSIFIGATLTATSVGITVRVFQELGKIKSKEAQIVIGAVVVGIISSGTFSLVDILRITALAAACLGGALLMGNLAAKPILQWVHQMRRKTGLNTLFGARRLTTFLAK